MKNLSVSLSMAAVTISLVSCAQNVSQSRVPAIIVNTFEQQFPKTNDVEWEKKGNVYEVEFETGLSGKDHTMLIDSLGKVKYHKTDIIESELSGSVKKAIAEQFPGYRIDDAEKIEANNTITYKVELKNKPQEWKITFSNDGKIIDKIAD